MSLLDTSFDGDDIVDINSVLADFQEDDEQNDKIPIRKLLDTFDNVAKVDGSLKVYLRVRPMSEDKESTVRVISETSILTNAPESSNRAKFTKTEERQYVFSRVFGPESNQSNIFDYSIEPLLDRFLRFDNCALFAYGMTNAGKTYTIQGTTQDPGILPRLVESILERTNKQEAKSLKISMLEIYQEKIFDLLGKTREKLQIRDANGRVEVVKLSSHSISNSSESLKLLDKASSMRSKAHTLLNAGSSRSHAVYVLTLNRIVNGVESTNNFQIVDLAGAERMNRTKANISQQKEANNINMSLMQLWRCLQRMKRKSTEGMDIIPFRESKLTHLLMPVLSRAGLSGVAMITCVNPQPEDYDETLSILGNASIATRIREIADVGRSVGGPVASSCKGICVPKPSYAMDAKETKKRKADAIAAAAAVALAVSIPSKKVVPIRHTMERTSSNESTEIAVDEGQGELFDEEDEAILSEEVDMEAVVSILESDQPDPKRMKIEMLRLLKTNQTLQSDILRKESEVRLEVSLEMKNYCDKLLTEIKTLQETQNERTSWSSESSSSNAPPTYKEKSELTKSCKKARKRHLELARDDIARDLDEAEEEITRMKVQHESEKMALTEQILYLKQELGEWKAKVESVTAKLESMPKLTSVVSTSPNRFSGTVHVVSNNIIGCNQHQPVAMTAAESFSKRMGRDARFQKAGSAYSPPRAVLGAVQEEDHNGCLSGSGGVPDENSCSNSHNTNLNHSYNMVNPKQPLQQQKQALGDKDKAPNGGANNNNNNNWFLRSHGIRGV